MAELRLYDAPRPPSPRRVRIFLAEKGIEVPRVTVDLSTGEHFSAEYRAVNPESTVPTLVLEDGRTIADSHAICHYFEGTHPEPPLMGRDAYERALVVEWSRRIDLEGYQAAAMFLRNTHPGFVDRAIPGVREGFPQVPALGDHAQRLLARLLQRVDGQLESRPFLLGEQFGYVDICLLVAIDFAKRMKPELPAHVQRWYDAVSARPSASA
ncbi:MAG: glutathione S-transferase family protein [Myxococcota bacterium]